MRYTALAWRCSDRAAVIVPFRRGMPRRHGYSEKAVAAFTHTANARARSARDARDPRKRKR